jgi:hypothetical protein
MARIPELIPNEGLISLRNTFGIDPRYLLADYNQYYTNMNDNMPIEKIDDGLASIDTGLPMYVQDNDGGNNFLQYTNEGAPGYIRPSEISAPMSQEYNLQDPTVMKISNFDQMFGPQTFTDSLGNVRTVPGEERFTLPEEKKGILQNIKDKGSQFLDFIKGGGIMGNIAKGLLPEQDFRATMLRDYYGGKDGSNLTSSGSIASGLMAGYNPVSGGFLHSISGGRFGNPTNYGLQRAYQKRIDMISKNLQNNIYKDPKKMLERLEKLKEEKRQEAMALEQRTIDRAREANPDVYRNAANIPGALGPGGGFSTTGKEGAFSSKSGRGRQDY